MIIQVLIFFYKTFRTINLEKLIGIKLLNMKHGVAFKIGVGVGTLALHIVVCMISMPPRERERERAFVA